jgi:hypothetical protein
MAKKPQEFNSFKELYKRVSSDCEECTVKDFMAVSAALHTDPPPPFEDGKVETIISPLSQSSPIVCYIHVIAKDVNRKAPWGYMLIDTESNKAPTYYILKDIGFENKDNAKLN